MVAPIIAAIGSAAIPAFGKAAGAAAGGSAISKLFGLFGGGRPSIPNVSPIRPGKFEQAVKTGLVFGPGNQYDLGLYGSTQTGTQRPQSQSAQTQQQPYNPNLRFRTSSSGYSSATPQGFGNMVIDPNMRYRSTGDFSQAPEERNYTSVQQGQPTDLYTDVFQGDSVRGKNGKKKKNPTFAEIIQEGIRRGQVPFDQQMALEGVGLEGFESGMKSGFEQVGDVNLIKDALMNIAGQGQEKQGALQQQLQDYITGTTANNTNLFESQVPGINDLFGRAANEFSSISTADASGRTRAFNDQSADIGNRAGTEGFTNVGIGRDITGRSLNETDYVKNLLSQRFGQTDSFLNELFSGLDPNDQAAIDDIYNTNIASSEDLFTTGRVGQKYNDLFQRVGEDTAARGFTPASSAYVDAARKVEGTRQQEFNDIINQQNATRAQNIYNAITNARESRLKAADIAGSGANSLASNLAPLLNAATGGVSASNDAIRSAVSGGSLVADTARNEIARGQLDLEGQKAKAEGLASVGTQQGNFATSSAGVRTNQQQASQAGLASVIDAALKGDNQALDALGKSGDLSISAGNLSNLFANTGLEGQAQGFNELLSLFDIGKGNRQDKQKLAIFNALAQAGLAGTAQ